VTSKPDFKVMVLLRY